MTYTLSTNFSLPSHYVPHGHDVNVKIFHDGRLVANGFATLVKDGPVTYRPAGDDVDDPSAWLGDDLTQQLEFYQLDRPAVWTEIFAMAHQTILDGQKHEARF